MIAVGDIVYSKAGHDKGNFHIVLSVDGEYVNIADGKRRKSDNPKKKKIKHLKLGFGSSVLVTDKIANGGQVTNRELREELQKINL